jgi:hypothetical protein
MVRGPERPVSNLTAHQVDSIQLVHMTTYVAHSDKARQAS